MAKLSEKAMAQGGSAAAQPMAAVDDCDCGKVEFWQKHHQNCRTQLHRQQDERHGDPADHVWVDEMGGDPTDDFNVDEEWLKVPVRPAYHDLFIVLQQALWQAQDGKGHERHASADDQPFTDQPVLTITRAVGLGFPLGQAMKKIQECQRMDTDAAKRELLGAINYLAAAVLFLDENAD
jgi:hypothetical protein